MAAGEGEDGTVELTDEQRLNWLRLIRSENVGPATFRDLINHFRSAATALEALPELIARGGRAGRIRVTGRDEAEHELLAAERLGARFIGMGEPLYPSALRHADYPPPLLCVRGNAELLVRPAVAIVGSRNASINGKRLAAGFASAVGRADYTILSGLARGIDASAHEHGLQSGTIAAFAGGVDHVFPPENTALADAILENDGAFVSEMPLGWRPRSKDFPRRNRIIAGMAQGLLVVEAARRSGSLISARLANEAGRMVFAVPGSPLDPRCAGTNWLIRNGATLVTRPEELIDDLGTVRLDPKDIAYDEEEREDRYQPPVDADAVRDEIIAGLGPAPVEIDDLIRFSNASAAQVQLVLIELDLAGRLERHAGNRVALIDGVAIPG